MEQASGGDRQNSGGVVMTAASLIRSITGGLRSLFRKERENQELEEELSGFLEMAAEEKMKQGMSRKDALRAVRLERGSLDVTKEIVWSARWESFVETLWREFRVAVRGLRQNDPVTAVVDLTPNLGNLGQHAGL